VLPGAELGTALLPGAGDIVPAVLVLGTGDHVLRGPCSNVLPDLVQRLA
jgi:hypothetical protein